MNKPAPKEPSMDEILSSIRQIIADDDAGARVAAPLQAAAAAPRPIGITATPAVQPVAPLTLSAEQIVDEDEPEAPVPEIFASVFAGLEEPQPEQAGYSDAELVEPDDVAFELEQELAPEPIAPPPTMVTPHPEPRPAPRPAAPVSRAAPMPDPSLSSEIAAQLLEPTTNAAVRHTFARLSNLTVGTPSVTIDEMMREMLRPMLKEWLDENLPSVVERMVEKEIARVSRGGE
jgi:cell pole-organizing protein PopZ